MERPFHNEDFERLLRDNANQYRMYPSEKVWKGIYSRLHNRRRWYGITSVLLLLLTGSIVTVSIINNQLPDDKIKANESVLPDTDSPAEPPSTIMLNRESNQVPTSENKQGPLTDRSERVVPVNQGSTNLQHPVFNPPQRSMITGMPEQNTFAIGDKKILTQAVPVADLNAMENKVEKTPDQDKPDKPNEALDKAVLALESQKAPIQLKPKSSRITAQVYFTPTVSYRKLSENKSYTAASASGNNVKEAVNHKPAMGLEVGIEGRYAITDKLFAKSGIQFNINRYELGAYFHPTEFATIPLNSGFGADSLTALSNYRNVEGAAPNWLENFYFTVSVPLGAELILASNKKMQWGISGSVQPTYVIGDRAYLISADYKNYAKVPNLMRRWNVSTDFETFIMYSTGRLKWQVGPQIRYQHLSSFVNEYRIKENLFDIGLKIGATINKK